MQPLQLQHAYITYYFLKCLVNNNSNRKGKTNSKYSALVAIVSIYIITIPSIIVL